MPESPSYDAIIVGARVAGTATFAQALDVILAAPLALDGLFVGVPEAELSRVAEFVGTRSLPKVPRPLGSVAANVLDAGARALRLNTEVAETMHALFPAGISGADLNAHDFRTSSMPAVNGHFDARSRSSTRRSPGVGSSTACACSTEPPSTRRGARSTACSGLRACSCGEEGRHG